jgi:hypothetical protein
MYVYTADKVIQVHTMKADGGVEILFHSFLTSALDGGKWSSLCLQLFISKERAPQHPLNRILSRLQRWSGHNAEEESLYPLGNET